ncbi:type II toxin-antitoxin system RelE/ParE family toxin [Roseateles sp.]|uniref:type II toxin-antitoxin system RelE/ParE family toxin n=1 Tax=Roseateles sp. TaxID=1971397 RepID=UPI0031DFDCE4
MSAVLTRRARRDLAAIIGRIEEDNPIAAERMFEEFSEKFRLLEEFPGIGTPTDTGEIRILPVKRNYRVHYRLPPPKLQIERVVHVARNWSGEGLPA